MDNIVKRLDEYTDDELACLSRDELLSIVEVELLGAKYHLKVPPAPAQPNYRKHEFLEIGSSYNKLVLAVDYTLATVIKQALNNVRVVEDTMFINPIPELVYRETVPIQTRTVTLVPYGTAQEAIVAISEYKIKSNERDLAQRSSSGKKSIEQATLEATVAVFDRYYAAMEAARRKIELAKLLGVYFNLLKDSEAAIELLRARFVLNDKEWEYVLKYNKLEPEISEKQV